MDLKLFIVGRGGSHITVHAGTAVKVHDSLFAYRTNNPQNLPE